MNKLKSIFYILIVVFFYSCNKKNETEKKINSNKVEIEKDTSTEKFLPQSFKEEVKNIGENIKIFVPENYAILDTVSGNLNLDNFVDMILVLKKPTEKKILSGILQWVCRFRTSQTPSKTYQIAAKKARLSSQQYIYLLLMLFYLTLKALAFVILYNLPS